MEVVTVTEELAELVAELNLEEQFVVVELLHLLIKNRQGKRHGIAEVEALPDPEPGSTLWEMGIDAQDWVNELRGKR